MRNGNIISRPMLGFPFLNHYGIVVDSDDGTIADFGSRGKRVISVCEFMANQTSMQIYQSNMMDSSPDEILKRFEKVKTGPFTIWWNNCADFMKHFGRADLYHKELRAFFVIIMMVIIILAIYLNN
tara:strand:- start:279 stop:656 length:378 start_codon:yes stop_codon:yes gene_type:complete